MWPRLKRPIPDRSAQLEAWLLQLIESTGNFAILQVGAYDGLSNDHVHALVAGSAHVRATLLEPQPHAYAALAHRWREMPRVTPLQCALGDRDGTRALYVIAEPFRHRHPFPDQVASFSRAHVETACARYVWRPSEDFITSIQVEVISWATLVERFGPFHFVAIDAEGYDGEIIHQMDLQARAPLAVLYEHRHLSRAMRHRCESRLRRHGYTVRRVSKTDTIASRVPMDF